MKEKKIKWFYHSQKRIALRKKERIKMGDCFQSIGQNDEKNKNGARETMLEL
jgi:hypothetical protein